VIGEPSDEETYEMTKESLPTSLNLDNVTIKFKQSLLCNITTYCHGTDVLALKEAFKTAYGRPAEDSSLSVFKNAPRYDWKGDHCYLTMGVDMFGMTEAEFSSPDVDEETESRAAEAQSQLDEQELKNAQDDAAANAKSL
jgi:hypothetical protein